MAPWLQPHSTVRATLGFIHLYHWVAATRSRQPAHRFQSPVGHCGLPRISIDRTGVAVRAAIEIRYSEYWAAEPLCPCAATTRALPTVQPCGSYTRPVAISPSTGTATGRVCTEQASDAAAGAASRVAVNAGSSNPAK